VKQWWLAIALVLSIGTNIGVLAMLALVHSKVAPQQQALRPGNPGQLHVLADRLELRGEVRQRFLERQRRLLRESALPRKRMAEIRLALRAELIAARPNRQRIDLLIREAGGTFMQLEKMLTDCVLDTRALLPPDAERRYVELLSHLKLEGPGSLGRLPPALWRWFRTGGPPPPLPPEVLPSEQAPGSTGTAPPAAGSPAGASPPTAPPPPAAPPPAAVPR
jgi:hypothetical protein